MLAGIKNVNPLNRIFYMQADTSGISGAPPLTRWTLWNRCGVSNGVNSDCTGNHPAYAFQPDVNFGTTSGVPSSLMNHHSRYYYLSRFAFAFFFIATIFSGLAFLSSIGALFSRLVAGCTSILTFIAFITDVIAASLATALYVQARNAFKRDGYTAHLGVKLFAFAWTTVACLFLASLGFILACCAGRDRSRRTGGPIVTEKGTKRRFFTRRNQYTPDGESQTHVMEEQPIVNEDTSY